jgi:tetratricopeptide (TPR) repeat protein
VPERAPALRARLLARLATAKLVSEGPERVGELSNAAIAAAMQSGEDLPRAEALIARTWALWTPEHTERRLGIADDLVRLAERLGDPVLRIQSRIWRVVALGELSKFEDVEKEIPRPDARGSEWIVNKYYGLAWRGTLALARGELDDAQHMLDETRRLAAERPFGNLDHALGIKIFALLRERGEIAMLREPLADLVSRYPAVAGWRAALALAHAESGYEDDARREFEFIAAGGFEALPRDFNWLSTLSVLAPTCALVGSSDHAEALYGLLQPYAHRAVVVAHFLNWSGPVSYYLGDLALCGGRIDQSIDHFEDALQRSQQAGSRLFAIRAQRGLVMALLARDGTGDAERARALRADALATARELGLTALEARLRGLAAHPHAVGPTHEQ